MTNTSSTASYNNCSYSTNGGYFNTTNGQCIGNVITNGITQQVYNTGLTCFIINPGRFSFQVLVVLISVLIIIHT